MITPEPGVASVVAWGISPKPPVVLFAGGGNSSVDCELFSVLTGSWGFLFRTKNQKTAPATPTKARTARTIKIILIFGSFEEP